MALGVEELFHHNAWLFVIGYSIARMAVWPLWFRQRQAAGLSLVRPVLFGSAITG